MIGDEDLADMVDRTRRLRQGFAGTAPRAWDPATAGAELAVQLGHVALCVARHRGMDVSAYEDVARPIGDLGDELADVTLAALSISVLADVPPAHIELARTAASGSEIEALLLLLVCAGQAVEAGLVAAGYRHQPTGTPVLLPQASAATVTAAAQFAGLLGLDLPAEFRAMNADASDFLTSYRDGDAR
ncbi:hypothetical protein [Acrocarpospora sp. B8E8]|uniref:hypothetical protein n=1 Tax=Acrocarpospora sp. B8E8 TaxID=3153572 RepID=UPI00325CDEB0